ncbi:ligand-binding sensor domain-containing protein [Alkalitalea saponilacus]|uniref:histidine kinase n=1 Tax=Alkalitalea saponilacus TaxID=889453 RepID=A0A1T5HSG2_9BACT|nr:sensor histidine kinase [Alkalitalea saponilacus]ASB47704.1 hypothetical protein CDL62_00305 [Alkalitalea saponilacus]SKC23629.1 Signal transduction histidine kinase [Alkalitalea saponilacus]
MLRVILTYIIFIFSSLCSIAQNQNKQFIQFTTATGLSHSHVRAIYQDRFGYMWFGTGDGLNRFDGHNFRVFTAGLTQYEGLIHPSINDISKKNEDEMWICTSLGVSIYNHNTDAIYPFHYFQNQNIERSFTDSKSNVWFGSQNGLFKYIPEKDTIITFTHSESPNSLSHSQVRSIFEDSSGNLWIGTNNGLNLYLPEEKSFKWYDTDFKGEVRSIVEDKNNRLWIGVSRDGVYEFKNYLALPENGTFSKLINSNVNKLIIRDNQLWVGNSSGGNVTVVDLNSVTNNRESIKYSTYAHYPQNMWGLSDNNISSLYKDKNGDIWIGTYSGGVNLYSARIKQFRNYIVNPVPGMSISSHLITSFLDDDDYLWIGTGVGLDRLKKETGEIRTFYSSSYSSGTLKGEGVLALYRDSRDNFWVGTWNGGLNLFNPDTETFKTYTPSENPGSISSPHVFAIKEDQNNNLWVATNHGGLNRFDYENENFEVFRNNPDDPYSLPHNSVNHFFEASDGTLMLTCYSAFSILNKDSGTFTNFIHDPSDPKSLRRGQALFVFEDSNNNIWVAGNLGLNLFNKEDGTFIHYTTYHGLPNNTIQGILEDDHKNLWISTNKGIAKFIKGADTPQKPNFRLYDQYDGLAADDFRPRAAKRGTDGYMNFGTSRGFVRFHPDHIHDNPIPPEIIITDFHVFGTDENENIEEQLGKINVNTIDEILLKYRQNNITIFYSAINYLNPQKNSYKYQLEGYESQWHEVENRRFATYTNLNPGTYTFKVAGTNNDGVWSLEPKELKIVIIPPWWQTQLFRIATILFILLCVYLGIQYRFRAIRRRNIELEESVAKRTVELSETNALLEESKEEITCQNYELERHRNQLEELVTERTKELIKAKEQAEISDRLKTAFLANLSHELRTPMNAIVGFSNLLVQPDLDNEEKNSYIQMINTNTDTLLTLINDILDISMIETNQLSLTKQWFAVRQIMEELIAYFNMKNEKDIELKVIPDNSEFDLELFNDPIRIKQVLSNLLTNAIKFTNEGYVHFGWKTENNSVTFFVRDTGIGIEKEEIPKIFKSFYKIEKDTSVLYRGTGLGLALSKKILNQMGSTIEVESEPGKGSMFYFSLPLMPDKDS